MISLVPNEAYILRDKQEKLRVGVDYPMHHGISAKPHRAALGPSLPVLHLDQSDDSSIGSAQSEVGTDTLKWYMTIG